MSNSTVVIDNGGYTIKVGTSENSLKVIPNCIMKAKSERRRPFIGNQIDECRDASGLFYILPFQKGYIVNWDIQKTVWDYMFSKDCTFLNLNQSPVIITEPPFDFPSNQEAMAEIFFEEYECRSLLRINPTTLSYYHYKNKNPNTKCGIIVDAGYSFCHIIPYVLDTKLKAGIRRVDVGGKLLTNHLKEIISYRQLHVMDETYVINQAKEDSCFVSQDFRKDIKIAKMKLGSNTIAKDYVLPDYTSIRRGYIQEPGVAGEQQVLRLNNERFTIPEILFHPSDVGIDQMGIPEAIIDCLKACDEVTWPHLLSNIVLTGGCAKFPGFKERVWNEVRTLAPSEFTVNVHLDEDPISYAWKGGKLLSNDPGFSQLLVTREEYEEDGHNICYNKFDI